MFLIKFMRVCRIGKCKVSASTWVPMVLYIAFITFMLSITFPNGTRSLKAHNRETTSAESSEDQGELNRVFIGDSIKDIEPMVLSENSDASNVLKFAFRKADSSGDGFVTIRELAKYINLKICDHIDSSIKRNPQIFSEIDRSPTDGLVSWNEYHTYFLKNLKLGLDENYITNHDEKKHIKLDRKSKEALMRDKARWTEVLASDPASLTLDEFLAFQHPEASTSNLLNLVEDILRHFDTDGDDLLTADEFTNTYSSSADNKKLFLSDNLQERRAEFKTLIDKNHDGKVSWMSKIT
jgi:calcium-binding protein